MHKSLTIGRLTATALFAMAAVIGAVFLLASVQSASAASTLFDDAEIVSGGNPGQALQLRSDATPGWGSASFDDANGALFSTLSTLSADYNVTNDDCGAGSPRYQIQVDEDNDNVEEASDGNIFVYFGPSPSFTDCAPGWQSTGNLIGNNDAGRWDATQITGGSLGTYTQALAVVGTMKIWDISVVVDSGWNAPADNDADGEQTVLIDNVVINSATYDFEPAPAPMVTVTIDKFIDGAMATSGSANSSAFPMSATWNATNIGAGSGSYDLDADGFNGDPTPYQAITSQMTSGADYTTSEVTGGSVVGATCQDGKPYALNGYSSGDSLAQAQAATTSSSSPAFTNITSNKYVIVWNVTCAGTSTPPTATTSQVTIVKYVNGVHATAANATSTTFPFTATYNASNIGAGSDPFTIGPVGNGTPNAYEAMTIPLANGAMYNATENTGTVVGNTCQDGKPFALNGYSSGDTLAQAQSASTSSTSPTFNNLQSNKYVIVWNVTCAGTSTPPAPVPPANACATPGTAPAGYTLQNGTSGNNTVVLAPNTMYVGKGGNDHVSGGDGNYIVCMGNGNDTITLGNGNSTIDAGGGNNTVTVGNGEGTIKTGNGNDTVVAGDGARTIAVGGGNNKVTSGDGAQTITAGAGNDEIKAGAGQDQVNAGGGNNKVWGEDGDDMLTTAAGNDKLDGGAGTDTCQAGAGINTKTYCEL